MPKLGMEPKRRADVINATLTCISLHGMDGMTLDKVAEYAGCSKGVVAYYYKNKDHLTIEAFKSFLAYYSLKIESEIENTMTASEMIDVTLKHILPPYGEDAEKKINVSQLDGIEKMFIPYEDQARLFLQFFSKAVLDRNLQEVAMVTVCLRKRNGSMRVKQGRAVTGMASLMISPGMMKTREAWYIR